MPIYEFYCDHCNTIVSFLSRGVNTTSSPPCPKCRKAALDRRISMFAVATGGRSKDDAVDPSGGGADAMDKLPFDEARMEKAMESLAGEAEKMDENDPRAAADLMRKLSDMTGLQYGDKMQEAIARMESGEDPESIEADLGPALENEDPFTLPESGSDTKVKARRSAPLRDETLYEM